MALIDKASLLMVPSTYEAGKLYNVLPSGNRAPDSTDQNSGYDQTRADFDFDRGSNAAATRIGSDGLIKKYRENFLLQSNNFGTTWLNSGTTETSGQSGYDETNDAWLITKSVSDGYIYQNISQSGVQCVSVYAKANALGGIQIYVNAGTTRYQSFNLTNGTLIGSGNGIDAKIESVGNGWYRCSISFNDTITRVRFYPMTDAGDKTTTSGSIYIQSAQVESSLVATDYLDSTSVTAKAGVLVDLPRINYDANGENGALLLEPSRTNNIPNSEYFGDWGVSAGTLTANSTTSPEGVQNAYLFTEDTTTGYHRFAKNSGGSNSTKTFSVFAKWAGGSGRKWLTMDNGPICYFDLENGVKGNVGANCTADIEDYGNGWYRCYFTHTNSATGTLYIGSSNTNGGAGNHLGNGENAFYLYGSQAEDGASYVSSYIPTMGTSETRAADSCLGATDASLFNDSSMSLFLDLPATNQETAIKEITISDGTSNNRFNIYSVTSNQLRTSLVSGGSVILNYVFSDIITNQHLKILITYTGSTYKVFVNGALELNVTMSTPPVGLNNINFANATDSSLFYGQVKEAAVFTEALTDAECVTLTTL